MSPVSASIYTNIKRCFSQLHSETMVGFTLNGPPAYKPLVVPSCHQKGGRESFFHLDVGVFRISLGYALCIPQARS